MLRHLIGGRIAVLLRTACNSSSSPAYLRVFHAPAAVTPDSNSSLAVSYLIESVGLSPSAALAASKDVRLKTTAKADSVLLLLSTYGFTRAQIVDIVTRLPVLLSADTERIKHKLEFLLGAGMPKDHLLRIITLDPCILKTSLEKRLIPNIALLKTILGNITQVSSAIASSTRLVRLNLENHVLPNIRTLQNHGVPQHRVVKLATLYPRSLLQNPVKFSRSVGLVKDMGLDPWKVNYILAVNVLSGATQSTWERKMQLYRSFGWSEEETISAFKKHPFCMLLSDVKIKKVITFIVQKLKLPPSFVALRPKLLAYSFEKRLVPRFMVMNTLKSKGLIKRRTGLASFMDMSEELFLYHYITKNRDKVPNLLEAYQAMLA